MTIQQASDALGLDYAEVRWHLNVRPELRIFLLDVAMLADYRKTLGVE
jgi:hypothetical protein